MKKNGFTLSELLIALGVVAVASALIAPQITKIIPDKAKLKVISTNAKIEQETSDLVSNDAIYWCNDGDNRQGLACEGQAMTPELRNNPLYSGDNKYRNLMVYKLNLTEDNSLNGFTHVSSDGVYWNFQRHLDVEGHMDITITIDINGEKGPNRIFGQDNITKNNDRFRFNVDEYGNVTPNDALSAAYTSKNNLKFNDKKNDRQRAARMLENNADFKNF